LSKARNRSAVGWLAPLTLAVTVVACHATSTEFIHEGRGQPSDRASGVVPDGAIGVCKKQHSMRPPLVDPTVWEHAQACSDKTPYRFIRLGFGDTSRGPDVKADTRMQSFMETLKTSSSDTDGNTKMLRMLRRVQQEGKNDVDLQARIQRGGARSFACDYAYLLGTTSDAQKKDEQGPCPAKAYDTKARGEACIFDMTRAEAQWLTGAWGCVADTGTVGEGKSCYRLCEYDDYCASQVGCAAPDLDLLLCALGICLPEKVAGLQ
jgi:hypothetical protein